MTPAPRPGVVCVRDGQQVHLDGSRLVHEGGGVCSSQRFAITWHTSRDEAVDALDGLRAARELMER